MTLHPTICAASIAIALTGSASWADDKATVSNFYDLLSNPGAEAQVEAFKASTSYDWESVGNYSGKNKTRDTFLGQVRGFGQLIPDLQWDIQDMHQDGNFVTVRSRATGTPNAPFFGVDGDGRSFDIMTIDIHELDNGKIIRTYHVEDWAGALKQLSGQ